VTGTNGITIVIGMIGITIAMTTMTIVTIDMMMTVMETGGSLKTSLRAVANASCPWRGCRRSIQPGNTINLDVRRLKINK
jgi:hypothetical protein